MKYSHWEVGNDRPVKTGFFSGLPKFQYAKELSGTGAQKTGGRWNFKGIPLLYTADSIALASLETLVHTPLNLIPQTRSVTIFEMPDHLNVKQCDLSQLPQNWRAYPSPVELAQIGTRWFQQAVSVALRVPSSIIPLNEGWNYLLNPLSLETHMIPLRDTFVLQSSQGQ